MDAFLEDGSHEATITVVRALVVSVPHTTDRLRDYILFMLSFNLYYLYYNIYIVCLLEVLICYLIL